MLMQDFERAYVTVGDIQLYVASKQGPKDAPAVLLLHGYPQTHAMWHPVAPALAEQFTVICADLRGYGDSTKVEGSGSHVEYSKRAMAQDMVDLMRSLGHERFAVVGHDRGGRVTHRLCLDHPDVVTQAAVIDIIPTHTMFQTMNSAVALGYYHWLFLAQPRPLPERLLGSEADFYMNWVFGSLGGGFKEFHPEAVEEYRRCFNDPGTIHAICEDYRAAASIDLEHDEADLDKKIDCPLLVMWGTRGLMHKTHDFEAEWRKKAADPVFASLDAGHFLIEEKPEEAVEILTAFLTTPAEPVSPDQPI